jgi:hypothetical protein
LLLEDRYEPTKQEFDDVKNKLKRIGSHKGDNIQG